MSEFVGQTVLHYRVIEQVGQGGMGVVYKAQDLSLGREVAIKFLPRSMVAGIEERERFKIEARAAAALNHPNIATIHAIEEVEGDTFIVMEYIDGQELKEIVHASPAQELDLRVVLDVAIQIAEGLKAAHEKGVIHRDIKASNIMITQKGQAKIMDFGLAKVRGGAQVTKLGTTLGTAAYMSPEQARGEMVDQRTDIWSFGVLLYEMLTGRLPFAGDYEQAVVYSILNEQPAPVAEFRDAVPANILEVLDKALAKDSDERYQNMEEVLADISQVFDEMHAGDRLSSVRSSTRRLSASSQSPQSMSPRRMWLFFLVSSIAAIAIVLSVLRLQDSGPTPTDSRKMLVVLPFENLGQAEDDYFADGITEELTSRLAVVHGLGVISRTSAIQYKRTKKTIAAIGDELGVDYVLEGTVRWERSNGGRRIRVTPQLIRVSDDTHLWTKSYDRVLDEIFAVQTEVAEEIVRQLDLTLLEPERRALQAQPTRDLEAYDSYLRGKQYSEQYFDPERQNRAVEMFERAVALDSTFALAFAQLSLTHSHIYHFTFDPSAERMAKAKAAAEKAIGLQPDLPEAQEALAYYSYRNKNFDRALELVEAIRRVRPNYSPQLIGLIQRRQGRWLESIKHLEQAFRLNPRDANLAVTLLASYTELGDFQRADTWAEQAVLLDPDNVWARVWKVTNLVAWRGRTESAWPIVETLPEGWTRGALALDLHRIDRNYEEALAVVSSLPMEPWEVQWIYQHKYAEYARIYWLQKNEPLCRTYADSARKVLERQVQERPGIARLRSALGLVYAYLGKKEAAIRAGRRALELFPVSHDAVEGPEYVQYLAQIYTIVGELDLAIETLDDLMSIPSLLSVARLKADPMWTALRRHPRFQRLIEASEQRNG